MLASAYRLLSLENPSPQSEQESEVPSRDAPTFAQQLRGSRNRFIATPALTARLARLPLHQATKITVCVSGVRRCMAAVTTMEVNGEPVWKDDRVPVTALDGLIYSGSAIHLAADTATVPVVWTASGEG